MKDTKKRSREIWKHLKNRYEFLEFSIERLFEKNSNNCHRAFKLAVMGKISFFLEFRTLRRFLMPYCEFYQCFWVLLRPSARYPAKWDLKNSSRVVIRVHWSMCVKLHYSLFTHFLRLPWYFSVSCFFTKIKGGIIWDSFILINMENYYAHLLSELFWFMVSISTPMLVGGLCENHQPWNRFFGELFREIKLNGFHSGHLPV